MKLLLRFEEFGLFGLSIYLFALLAIRWWWFPVLLLTPDVTMVAYVGGPRLGAIVYDLAHHRGVALLIYGAGILATMPVLALAGVIMFAHSTLDRCLGYGLKYADSFQHTHLGRIGPGGDESKPAAA